MVKSLLMMKTDYEGKGEMSRCLRADVWAPSHLTEQYSVSSVNFSMKPSKQFLFTPRTGSVRSSHAHFVTHFWSQIQSTPTPGWLHPSQVLRPEDRILNTCVLVEPRSPWAPAPMMLAVVSSETKPWPSKSQWGTPVSISTNPACKRGFPLV